MDSDSSPDPTVGMLCDRGQLRAPQVGGALLEPLVGSS